MQLGPHLREPLLLKKCPRNCSRRAVNCCNCSDTVRLAKNTAQLIMLFALSNVLVARRYLLVAREWELLHSSQVHSSGLKKGPATKPKCSEIQK